MQVPSGEALVGRDVNPLGEPLDGKGAIAATALAFGLVHPPPLALPAALLGAGFGWLAMRSGSLLPAILAHAVHNGATIALAIAWPATLDYLYPR
jgi:membrane protease YdiL (CAAX protease family)